MVVIYYLGHFVDETNHTLSVGVTGSCFSTEHNHPRDDVLLLLSCHSFDSDIAVDDVQDVHELALILVQPLNLNVKHPVSVHVDFQFRIFLDPMSQPTLVLKLNSPPLRLELLIVNKFLEGAQFIHVQNPFVVLCSFGVEVGQQGIGGNNPSSGCHTVGLVLELLGIELAEILEEGMLDEFAVDGCYTVDCVRADYA